jgi:hypothetical protein
VRPLGIFPGAEATMSILPSAAQASARQNRAMMVKRSSQWRVRPATAGSRRFQRGR